MIFANLIWHELPGDGLPPLGRTVLVHCPSDPERVGLAFYAENGCWYDPVDAAPCRHAVTHWAEVKMPV